MSEDIDINVLATSYKRLVLWVGTQALLVAGQGFHLSLDQGIWQFILALCVYSGIWITLIALAYHGYRMAQALGSKRAWLWAVAMFMPCASIITLLALSAQATQACRARGIPVGFLGPKLAPRDRP